MDDSNILGKTFGNWKVIEIIKKTNRPIKLLCTKCNVSISYITFYKLIKLTQDSCCRVCTCKLKRKNIRNVCTQVQYTEYKRRAQRTNYMFSLTLEDIDNMLYSNCYWCNNPPNREFKRKYKKGYVSILRNGIDRLDNTKGYAKENCVPCCWDCNEMKKDRTIELFLNQIKKIYHNKYEKEIK